MSPRKEESDVRFVLCDNNGATGEKRKTNNFLLQAVIIIIKICPRDPLGGVTV